MPFVEVTCGGDGGLGWDTHADNFESVRKLSQTLDPAWATLMTELKSRGLLESTTIVWMGEFGRTPKINDNRGRDHYPNAWSTVLAGGGIRGGQVVGRTSADGTTVEERAGLGARPVGHGVAGVGHRSDEAKRLERWPPHSPGRSGRQARGGDRGMKRLRAWLAAWAVLATPCTFAIAEDRAESSSGLAADVQDILFLGPIRPLLVRLRISVDGHPFRQVWQNRFNELFEQEDRDHDGRMTIEEAGAIMRDMSGGLSDIEKVDFKAARCGRRHARSRRARGPDRARAAAVLGAAPRGGRQRLGAGALSAVGR